MTNDTNLNIEQKTNSAPKAEVLSVCQNSVEQDRLLKLFNLFIEIDKSIKSKTRCN